MYLNRIHINTRCREARRDLADPYQLHSTLSRAFSVPDIKCPRGEFLWRLEPESDPSGYPRILVQSRSIPNWSGISIKGWLAKADPAIDLNERLKLDSLKVGRRFRFRMRANPCVCSKGKRQGLLKLKKQEEWIARQGQLHGFLLPQISSFDYSTTPRDQINVRISQQQMLRGVQHSGNALRIFSVLYDGILLVNEPAGFKKVLQTGIGHGKVMGLGLLSVVPIE